MTLFINHENGYCEIKDECINLYFNFIPISIFDEKYDKKDISIKERSIISFPSFIYGRKNISSIKITKEMNENLRLFTSFVITKDIEEISKIIQMSPKVDKSFVVYRGLPLTFSHKIGEILTNLGFIYTSIDKNLALWYGEYDTSLCYLNNGQIDISKAIKNNKRYTLFKIKIPANYSFYEFSAVVFCHPNTMNNETILNHDTKLKIINIIHCDKYDIISCKCF